MSNCWKSRALAQLLINANSLDPDQGGPNENYIQHFIEYLTSQKTQMTLLSSANFSQKFLSGSNGLDPETACKGYQQTTKVTAGKGRDMRDDPKVLIFTL